MSQGELARRLGLDKSHVSKIVRGLVRPTIERAVAFSEVLGVPVEELFGRDEGAS